MNFDLSKVPHLEERQALLVKLAERKVLIDERDAISAPFDAQREPTQKAEEEADNAARAAFDAVEREQNAIIAAANKRIVEARSVKRAAMDASGDARAAAQASINEAEQAALLEITERIEAFDTALLESLGAEDHPWVSSHDDDFIERCMLTGLPLRDEDEKLADDDNTGGYVLRAVLFAPEEPSDAAKAIADKLDNAA